MAFVRVSVACCAVLCALCPVLFAQGAPRYTSELLRCVAYAEEVKTTVEARRGLEGWQERGNRAGTLQVRAAAAARGLTFAAWYDSLVVEYTGPGGKLTPDTDGLVGGRWTGVMLPHGEVALTDRPFMPPELAQVSDLSDQMLDFFPPLATVALAPGGHWTDSLGLEVERLRDSAAGGERLLRFKWRITSMGGAGPAAVDTSVRLRQEIEDEGTLAWSIARGPVSWRREITVDTRLGAGRRGGTPAEGRVTQRVSVRRVTDPADCR